MPADLRVPPSVRQPATAVSILARPLTSFVGRARELGLLEERFASHRLVTILGPPGAGKTRLAEEFARRVLEWSEWGGTWACDLAESSTSLDVCRAVGRSLEVGLPDEGAEAAVLRLASALAARGATLLLLDNFEPVVRVAAELLVPWLQGAPDLRILVTSRERLGVPGEVVVELGPLPLPARPDDLGAEAAELFVERVRALRPDYAPEPQDAPVVVELLRRLDGLPLAIELAAARMGVLGPKQLLDRLARSGAAALPASARGGSVPPPRGPASVPPPGRRGSTLLETLGWSFDTLEAHERSALAQLSVFHGGFSIEAAEAVVDVTLDAGAPEVLEILGALRDKSLVRAAPVGELGGELRFDLLETIRRFAAERLAESGTTKAVEERHGRYYLAAGAAWAEAVEKSPEALRRLALDLPNLLEVHRRALATPGAEATTQVLEAAVAVEHLFYMRGPTPQYLALVEAALARPVDGVPIQLVALARKAHGRALRDLGRRAESAQTLERGVELAVASGDAGLEGRLRGHLGLLHQSVGDMAKARTMLDEAIACTRRAGDLRAEGMLLAAVGQVEVHAGAFDAASEAFDQAQRRHRQVGNRYAEAFVLASRAEVNRARGRSEAARADLEQALAIYREFGERRHEGEALAALGLLHHEQGRLGDAREALEAALSCHREYGARPLEGRAEGALGDLEREEGLGEAARGRYTVAAALAREAGDASAEARWLFGLSATDATLGRLDSARALAQEGAALLGKSHEASAPYVRLCRAHVLLAEGDRAGAQAELDAVLASGPRAQLRADARMAARLLERALAARPPTLSAPPPSAPGTIVVSESGRWMRLPGGEELNLARRHALRLIVQRFVGDRLEHPGRALTQNAILDAGWPGERVTAHAAALRVYNALSTLRKLGLRNVLLSRDDGYLLDPRVPLSQIHDADVGG